MSPSSPRTSLLMVDRDRCGICGCCVPVCATVALVLHDAYLEVINDRCTSCQKCIVVCPTHALSEVALTAMATQGGGR